MVNCPPLDQLKCPPDSHRREIGIDEYNLLVNTTEEFEDQDEFLEACCVPKGCLCDTCTLPDCENNFILEIRNQSEWVPGKCCPKAECISKEPNCTNIENSNNIFWSKNCKKCSCKDGAQYCLQECEVESSGCYVMSLNQVISNGGKWQHNCKECECFNGEEKCAMSLCQNPQCNHGEYSFTIPGECCPSCFIKVSDSTSSSTSTTSRSSSSSSSSSPSTNQPLTTPPTIPKMNENISTERFEAETPSISIESVCPSYELHIQLLYAIIALLVITCATLIFIIRRNAAKKRSFSISQISGESGRTILLPQK